MTMPHQVWPVVQVMHEEVLEPFGLKNTSLDRLDLNATGLLHGYVTLRGERVDTTDNAFATGSPASGAVSTWRTLMSPWRAFPGAGRLGGIVAGDEDQPGLRFLW